MLVKDKMLQKSLPNQICEAAYISVLRRAYLDANKLRQTWHRLMAASRARQICCTVNVSDERKDGRAVFLAITHTAYPCTFCRRGLRNFRVCQDCRRLLCFLSFLGHNRAV